MIADSIVEHLLSFGEQLSSATRSRHFRMPFRYLLELDISRRRERRNIATSLIRRALI